MNNAERIRLNIKKCFIKISDPYLLPLNILPAAASVGQINKPFGITVWRSRLISNIDSHEPVIENNIRISVM